MSLNIKTKNFDLTPAVSDYLNKRLEALQKFHSTESPTAIIEVELSKTTRHHEQGRIFYAEINLSIGGKLHRAVSERETIQEAIDEVKDEILRELRKDKRKEIRFTRRTGLMLKEFTRSLGERGGNIARRLRRRR
jgi:ribosomal subunit interface protein